MFSYRHAFHAGNHADVLKHAVLVHIFDHFNKKPAPYWVIDTHAGAGFYDLTGEWAQKKAEYTDGIARIADVESAPAMVTRYLEEVAALNPDSTLRYYPGSPWLAMQSMRESDRLRLFELHPSEVEILREGLTRYARSHSRRVTVTEADGFDGIKALLPPPTRRGMVMIDPSYEAKQDYRRTFTAVQEGLKRFATGCFVVWYPLVQRPEVQSLIRNLERLDTVWLNATLKVSKPAVDGYGLHGSGMFVVNPPWTLDASLGEALPWLTDKLAQDNSASFTLARSEKS